MLCIFYIEKKTEEQTEYIDIPSPSLPPLLVPLSGKLRFIDRVGRNSKHNGVRKYPLILFRRNCQYKNLVLLFVLCSSTQIGIYCYWINHWIFEQFYSLFVSQRETECFAKTASWFLLLYHRTTPNSCDNDWSFSVHRNIRCLKVSWCFRQTSWRRYIWDESNNLIFDLNNNSNNCQIEIYCY